MPRYMKPVGAAHAEEIWDAQTARARMDDASKAFTKAHAEFVTAVQTMRSQGASWNAIAKALDLPRSTVQSSLKPYVPRRRKATESSD